MNHLILFANISWWEKRTIGNIIQDDNSSIVIKTEIFSKEFAQKCHITTPVLIALCSWELFWILRTQTINRIQCLRFLVNNVHRTNTLNPQWKRKKVSSNVQRRILYVAIMKAWAITHAPSTTMYSEIKLQDHKTRGHNNNRKC